MTTLALTLDGLRDEVGFYLGYGRDYAVMSESQVADVDASIAGGLRNFYFPKSLDGAMAHKWSFLEPLGKLTTVADQREYVLPEDLANIIGNITFEPVANVFHTIQRVGLGEINTRAQMSNGQTGRPTNFAVIPQRATGVMGQRFNVVFYPTPNDEWLLSFRYSVLPLALTSANPFPYGGVSHAETLLESCLAVAESRIQDERGLHQAAFDERLMASISMDIRLGPGNLGYNADLSDGNFGPLRRTQEYATYNGTVYTGA